jgi:outer membrane immunogenic protein
VGGSVLKVVAVVAAFVGTASTVASADGARSQPFSWSGIYIGANLGSAWGSADLNTDAGQFIAGSSYFTSTANIQSVNASTSGRVNDETLVGGVQIGANKQIGRMVFGVEVDYGTFNLNGSVGAANVPFPSVPAFNYTASAKIGTDWLITARGRLGLTLHDTALVYVTGGVAFTSVQVSNSYVDNAPSAGVGGGSFSDVKAGWTLGVGTEVALSAKWTLKAEYLHVEFGSVSVRDSVFCGPTASFCPAVVRPNSFSTSADLSADIARVGLNYKFD